MEPTQNNPPKELTVEDARRMANLSMTAISTTFGVPLKRLKAAKVLSGDDADAGFKASNNINWFKLEPWMKEHEAEIDSFINDSTESIKKANMIKDGVLKDLQIKQIKGENVDKKIVNAMMTRISTAQVLLLHSKFIKELLPKMKGKELPEMVVMTNQCIEQVIDIIQKQPVEKWEQWSKTQ